MPAKGVLIPRVCLAHDCGITFYVHPYRAIQKAKFCSKRCTDRSRTRRPLVERFWEKVAIGAPDDCWLWQASTDQHGYGRIHVEGMPRVASQVAWFLTYGYWSTQYVCHACDTPACANPCHLWEGTAAKNTADMMAKGRNGAVTKPDNFAKGERVGMAKLRDTDYQVVRTLHATGDWSYTRLAEHYGISKSGIHYIVKLQKY